MANYCSNSIRFISRDRSKLAVFLRKVYAAFDSRTSGFYNLLVLHGYTNKQIAGMIDRRDAFTHCDTKLSVDGDVFSFGVDTETAWAPHMEVFYRLISEKYGDAISMVYQSEECGCGIYINTDKEGKYFPEHYVVDCCHVGEFHKEYFNTYEEAIGWIQGEYKDFGFQLFDTVEDVERKVQDVSEWDEDGFFSFHEFVTDDGHINAERKVA